jgi:hypothetical protein
MRQSRQALGVADKKIAPGAEKARYLVDEFLLRFLIEINHYVSAEDEIK